MYATRPAVLKTVTHEEVTKENLGGAMSHNERSGVAHFAAEDEKEGLYLIRELISFIPQNNLEDPPVVAPKDSPDRKDESLNQIVPDIPTKLYDIRDVIKKVVDDGYFFEIQEHYARNIVIGFARMNGRPVGITANQPAVLAGCLDINSSIKGARFVRFCNAFNIPLLTFVDVPGFLPGVGQEYDGIIRHGAKVLFAYSAATVPKVTVVVRKAFGGGYIAMCSKALGADRSYAWP